MEKETLFTAAKWDLLKLLSTGSKSPLELAQGCNTSVSNVSQSLRFLELAGLVKSERISNRDKGLPRVLYSIAGNSSYIIVTSRNFVEKKQLSLNVHKKILLSIWFYENETWQPYLEKATAILEENLESINGIFLDLSSTQEIKLSVIKKDNAPKKEYKDTNITVMGASRKIKFSLIEKEAVQKSVSRYYSIYDPFGIISGGEGG